MYHQLTSEQGYYIYVEIVKGSTQKSIAKAIGVNESTISRKLKRTEAIMADTMQKRRRRRRWDAVIVALVTRLCLLVLFGMPNTCSKKLEVPIYFADSYASWQKGNVENNNNLVRQYIPKGTDISTVPDKKIASIQAKINRRPREKLNFSTHKHEFFKHYI